MLLSANNEPGMTGTGRLWYHPQPRRYPLGRACLGDPVACGCTKLDDFLGNSSSDYSGEASHEGHSWYRTTTTWWTADNGLFSTAVYGANCELQL